MNKKTLLIVEDEENIANAQKLILQDKFNVYFAKDGEEGLQKAKELNPDLIILDIMLPKMDGLHVCKNIRMDENLSETKILMVTAKDQIKDEIHGMELGADDYIMKPFEADELKHVVNQIMNN